MSEKISNLDQEMIRLKKEYLVWLVDYAAHLQTGRNAILQGQMDSEKFYIFDGYVHELAGTGAMFGFNDITKTARKFKDYTEKADESFDYKNVIPYLDRLITACDEALKSGT